MLKKIKRINLEDSANINWSNRSKVELEVIGIIRHRILFKTRPKALISRKYYLDYAEHGEMLLMLQGPMNMQACQM